MTEGSSTAGTALATTTPKPKGPLATLADYIRDPKRLEGIRQVMARGMDVERVTRIALAACSREPKLMKATPESVYLAIHTGVQLGLEPGSPLGDGYLVPFMNNKTNPPRMECQFIPGYQGMIKLARQSGEVLKIYAHVVHERDEFNVSFGLKETVEHKPCLDGDPGPAKFVYAVAHIRDTDPQFVVLTRAEVMKHRAKSKQSHGAWETDEEAMWLKTAIRVLFKYIPKSTEKEAGRRLAAALAMQGRAERGEPTNGVSPTAGWEPVIETTLSDDSEHVDPETGEVATSEAEESAQSPAAAAVVEKLSKKRGPAVKAESPVTIPTTATPTPPASQPPPSPPAKPGNVEMIADLLRDRIAEAKDLDEMGRIGGDLARNEKALGATLYGDILKAYQQKRRTLEPADDDAPAV